MKREAEGNRPGGEAADFDGEVDAAGGEVTSHQVSTFPRAVSDLGITLGEHSELEVLAALQSAPTKRVQPLQFASLEF